RPDSFWPATPAGAKHSDRVVPLFHVKRGSARAPQLYRRTATERRRVLRLSSCPSVQSAPTEPAYGLGAGPACRSYREHPVHLSDLRATRSLFHVKRSGCRRLRCRSPRLTAEVRGQNPKRRRGHSVEASRLTDSPRPRRLKLPAHFIGE